MTRHLTLIVSVLIVSILLVACGDAPAAQSPVVVSTVAAPAPTTASAQPTNAPAQPTNASAAPTNAPAGATNAPATAVPKGALTCPPTAPLAATAQLAARVNGQGISLDLYNRQMTQAQTAMTQNGGVDLKSASGQEMLKSLKQQVLDQMINEVVIAQQADREGIKVTDDDLNARLAQMIQDAGSVDKLNEYLNKNQLTLADLCLQVRNQLLGEAMLNRVTGALPTQVEQVHVRQILVSTPALAQQVRDLARSGKDFAELAKQYSVDETTKNNGGDLGWLPKGVLDPRLDAVMFDLPLNQVSDVITTQFGYHVIQVTEKQKSRALPPELIQNARQNAFLAWLQAVRDTLKIERLVQP